jgi:AraC family cel operon transcriptional repressor
MNEPRRLSAKNNVDMEAECLFRYVQGANDRFAPHCHDFYEIFLTVEGTVTHHVNGRTQKLPQGSLVFIRPDDVHGYRYDNPNSAETAYINFTFTRETAEQLFSYLSDGFPSKQLLACDMPPCVLLSHADTRWLVSRISALNCADWQDKKALKMQMRVLLLDVFTRFFGEVFKGDGQELPRWLSHLMTQMERPENFVLGNERMVELSGRSREHVARNLKKYCGVTVTEYINRLRINYASNLLINTNTPIITICFECGFQSMSYFYRVFKLYRSISPAEFRSAYGSRSPV